MSSVRTTVPFSKPWLCYSDQVRLLESRGLVVTDRAAAEQFLAHLNYYRFSGYCLAFETGRHVFVAGTTFEQIQQAYNFDLTLRDLLTEGLEAIEVDLRAVVAHYYGQHHGPFAHVSPNLFYQTHRHPAWLASLHEETQRSKELFVAHFKNTYSEFPDLPVWIVTEVMSFGCVSRMIGTIQRSDAKALARHYKLQPIPFQAAAHHFTYVRNLCAHHSRIWDRVWSIKPELPHGQLWSPPHLPNNNRLFATLLLMRYMMRSAPALFDFANTWQSRVTAHLRTPPAVRSPLLDMGLSPNWDQHALWV